MILIVHDVSDVRGKHSLHLAVSNGFLEMVKYLIGKGADIHVIDKYNRSCVHWAAMNKHYNVVKELLNSGMFWQIKFPMNSRISLKRILHFVQSVIVWLKGDSR